jgi:hypothetical protein
MKQIVWLGLTTLMSITTAPAAPLLPPDWNPKEAADKVLAGLVTVTSPHVKGAHDSDVLVQGNRAFVIYMANDIQPGEAANWPFIYVALSVVDLKTMRIEKVIPAAKGGQVYENETLLPGTCFVPRFFKLNDHTLRCFFASEEPGKRQSQTWFLDFDTEKLAFSNRIERAKIKTSAGTFPMQPQAYYEDAVAQGFTRKAVDFGLYNFGFKQFNGKTYCVVNNYPGGQNALAVLNDAKDTFEILGHYNEPNTLKLTESAVNILPDGSWMAICRQEEGTRNYTFTTSKDGRQWSVNEYRDFVPNGASSKPTFDRFGGVYYLGWQENTKINGVGRSVFNIDVSRDGQNWERKYRFETEKSFQYPSFTSHDGAIFLSVTQGDTSPSRKERIMFGKLEDTGM